MKPAGYWPCRNEIINAHLSTPHKYEPFTELFDTKKLDEIRDRYGADLYKECYADALREVMELNEHYTGKQRREALARFEELKKQRPGIEIMKDIEKRSWER